MGKAFHPTSGASQHGPKRKPSPLSVPILALFTLGWSVALTHTAYAQEDVGIRAGVSIGPDQFYFGGHRDFGPVLERLRFRPNLEIGVGDGTLIGVNLEFIYKFPMRTRRPVEFYAGAGPALNIMSGHFDGHEDHFDRRDTEVGGGFNILVGVAHRQGLFAEFKVAALDSPEVKFGVGYSFR